MTAPNLAREVELLKQQVTSLFSLVGQQAAPRDPSIGGFCQRHGISRGTFRNLRLAGKAPRETAVGVRRIITEDAEADWIREREAEALVVAEQRKVTGTRQGKQQRRRRERGAPQSSIIGPV